MSRVRRLYGEPPLHLVLVLASFVLVCYAGVRLLAGDTWGVVAWFVGAALLHDLVLVPVYATLDRAGRDAFASRSGARPGSVNHVRVPFFVSALLFLVWLPLILRLSAPYEAYTGLPIDVFLGRWLLVTAALFAGSALWHAAAAWRRARPRGRGPRRGPGGLRGHSGRTGRSGPGAGRRV